MARKIRYSVNPRYTLLLFAVFLLVLIILSSVFGSYTAEKKLRDFRYDFNMMMFKIVIQGQGNLSADNHTVLKVLLQWQRHHDAILPVFTSDTPPAETAPWKEVIQFVKSNRPITSATPQTILFHLYTVTNRIVNDQSGYLEQIQLFLTGSTVFFAIILVIQILRERSRETFTEALRQLSHRYREENENLRGTITREIHDNVIQNLAFMRISLESGTSTSEDIIRGLNSSIADLRSLISTMNPVDTRFFRLVFNLEMMCKNYQSKTDIQILSKLPPEEEIQLSVQSKISVFRIAQELFLNALQHSRATHIQIVMTVQHTILYMSINDNGVGFSPHKETAPGHLGLTNVRERVNFLKGKINIESRRNAGTRIHISIPMEKV